MFGGQVVDTIVKIAITLILGVVLIGLLPASPFQSFLGEISPIISQYIGYINWVFPVGKCLAVLTAWGVCIGAYYGIQWILKQLDIVSK